MYNANVLDTFINNTNAGNVKKASTWSVVKSKDYGDVVRISLRINDNLIIEDAKYKAFGGVHAAVYSSALCDLIIGKNLVLAQQVTSDDVVAAAGKLPTEKQNIASLPVIALMLAIKKFSKKMKK